MPTLFIKVILYFRREDMKNECRLCVLHKTRIKIVKGDGPRNAHIMFVGEAPGAEEDFKGKPFLGKAGRLLTEIIEEEGLKRKSVYVANVVRCRPPRNRCPRPDEIKACSRFLLDDIKKIHPKIICALGRTSAHFLTGIQGKISDLRKDFHSYKNNDQIKVKVTYHPSYLFRKPDFKKFVKQDIKAIKNYLSTHRG